MRRFKETSLTADIFHCSSGFNHPGHSDDLMLSKTGFTHSERLRWQNEYAGSFLKMNGSIMPGTHTKTLYSTNPAFL
ncbi:hypothetical protein BK797_15300 [Kosakonia sacchari]|nr:hypothetical protein BK797_15300 [Kosakonia sacchari]